MKKILIIALIAIGSFSCNEKVDDSREAKIEKIQNLKKEVQERKKEIDALEGELKANEEIEYINVKTQVIEEQVFEHFIEVTGSVEADKVIDVRAENAGIIESIPVREGQRVSKGQILGKIKADALSRSIDELEIQLQLAETNFERQKKLWDKNIGSEMQYLQAKNNKESLEKRIESMNAQVNMSTIKSPVSGVIDVIYQKTGEMASPQAPFAKVVNIDKIKIYADVSERYLNIIKKGETVSIFFPALEKEVEGKISQLTNSINPINRTFRIRIDLNNYKGEIKPNLVAVVKIRDYVNKEAVIIPSLYVKEDFEGTYTFIATKSDSGYVAEKVPIEVGVTNNNMTEILKGLEPGMQVVSEGYLQISDGTHIKIN